MASQLLYPKTGLIMTWRKVKVILNFSVFSCGVLAEEGDGCFIMSALMCFSRARHLAHAQTQPPTLIGLLECSAVPRDGQYF